MNNSLIKTSSIGNFKVSLVSIIKFVDIYKNLKSIYHHLNNIITNIK